MEDREIIQLYWDRDQAAIAETSAKYGRYCHGIARNVLSDEADAEECVNDTYLAAWNSMPPHRPDLLSAFLGKITRSVSLDRLRKRTAKKRGGGETAVALDELGDCVAGGESVMEQIEERELAELINAFIRALPEDEGNVFIRRYWYVDPISDIASRYGMSEPKVKSMLFRTRAKLKSRLLAEGITI